MHVTAAETSGATIAAAADALASRLREFRLPQEAVEREAGQLAQALRRSAGVLGPAAAAFSGSLQAAAQSVTDAAGGVAERIGAVEVPHDALSREIALVCEELRRSAQVLSREFGAAGVVVSQGASALGAAVSGAGGRAEVEAAVRNVADMARRAASGYQGLATAAEVSNRELAAIASGLRGVGEGLVRATELLKGLEQGTRGLSGEALSRATRELADAERAIAAAQSAGLELHQVIAEVVDFVREQLRTGRAI